MPKFLTWTTFWFLFCLCFYFVVSFLVLPFPWLIASSILAIIPQNSQPSPAWLVSSVGLVFVAALLFRNCNLGISSIGMWGTGKLIPTPVSSVLSDGRHTPTVEYRELGNHRRLGAQDWDYWGYLLKGLQNQSRIGSSLLWTRQYSSTFRREELLCVSVVSFPSDI